MMSASKICASVVPAGHEQMTGDSKLYCFEMTVKRDELDCISEDDNQEVKASIDKEDAPVNPVILSEMAELTEDEDEHSHGSFSSLFSDSSSDDESSVESTPTDLEQLEKEFARRDKVLQKLVKGIDPAHARAMREMEQAVRKRKLQQLQKDPKRSQSSQQPSDKNTDAQVDKMEGQIGSLERMRQVVAFEMQNTVPGGIIVVLYCIATLSCCQIISSLTDHDEKKDLLAVAGIFFAIFLFRFTGGLWEYVSHETYERIKSAMRSRLRLGKLDAIVMRWFQEQHPKTFILLRVPLHSTS